MVPPVKLNKKSLFRNEEAFFINYELSITNYELGITNCGGDFETESLGIEFWVRFYKSSRYNSDCIGINRTDGGMKIETAVHNIEMAAYDIETAAHHI